MIRRLGSRPLRLLALLTVWGTVASRISGGTATALVVWQDNVTNSTPADGRLSALMFDFLASDEVTFTLDRTDGAGAFPAASTLSPDLAREVAQRCGAVEGQSVVQLGEESLVTASRRLPLLSTGSARIALQRSLTTELEPSRQTNGPCKSSFPRA